MSHAALRNVEQRNSFFDNVRKRRNLGKPVLNTTSSNIKGFLEHLNVTKTWQHVKYYFFLVNIMFNYCNPTIYNKKKIYKDSLFW